MTAAVVVPAYRETLTGSECISLSQCCRVLSRHPLVLVVPDGLDVPDASRIARELGVRPVVERFPADCFESPATYNALLMSKAFYERFAAYDHILIHQLDAFVFSDRLEEFCEYGYDYIGAPWSHSAAMRRVVGNGGFSLRRVSAALQVLALRGSRVPLRLALRWWRLESGRRRLARFLYRYGITTGLLQSRYYLPAAACHLLCVNEDGFWGQNCDKLPFYATAPYDVAVEFALESDPDTAYARSGGRLPFGCHAWPRWNQDFWRPHINRFGYAWDGRA